MELDQLVRDGLYSRMQDTASAHIRPFDLDTLGQAFQLRETTPIELPSVSMLIWGIWYWSILYQIGAPIVPVAVLSAVLFILLQVVVLF